MKFSLIASAPTMVSRTLVLRALAASFALGGCVPATTYEQATSAAEVEREGHRRAALRLAAAESELERVKAEKAAVQAEKSDLEAQLAKEEQELAQTSLDMESAKKAQEEQSELVTQLRGELARVGDHLKAFQGDKDELADKLAEAESKVKLLEERIEYLRTKAETSEDAQKQLEAALADLDQMQGQGTNEAEATKEEPSEGTDGTDGETSADEGTDGPEDASPEESPAEVLPDDEGAE